MDLSQTYLVKTHVTRMMKENLYGNTAKPEPAQPPKQPSRFQLAHLVLKLSSLTTKVQPRASSHS